ncbi:alpha/beta hydrolase [Pseudomonas lopnurensis]|uniref:alpha/beta hydrolase n=1 Tax=Pseudomonas lopnurensis TaxID=1477517 RepID=UPI0028ADD92B|nr:alpha/beta hydrolase [Pseudomonas lopnurensis]
MQASGRPAFSAGSVEQARARSAQLRERTGAGPDVSHVEDLNIPGRGGPIPARVFSADSPEAVVLYLHGGGWVLGSIDEWDALARTFANALPASVLLLGYRLAPEHPYPAALDDAWDALQWACEHIEQLAGRQVPLIVIGDSAGGNLAAVLAQKARDAGGPSVAAQALIYPVTDVTMSTPSCAEFEDYPLFNTDDLRWLTRQYVGDDPALRRDPAVSPLFGRLDGLAPAVVLTCQYDPLRDEGNRYAEALSAAGTEVIAHEVEGMAHGFILMINLMPEATAWVERIAGDLRKLLR